MAETLHSTQQPGWCSHTTLNVTPDCLRPSHIHVSRADQLHSFLAAARSTYKRLSKNNAPHKEVHVWQCMGRVPWDNGNSIRCSHPRKIGSMLSLGVLCHTHTQHSFGEQPSLSKTFSIPQGAHTWQQKAQREMVQRAPEDDRARRCRRPGSLEQGAHARQRRDGDQVAEQLHRQPHAEADLRPAHIRSRSELVRVWIRAGSCIRATAPSQVLEGDRRAYG